MSFELVYRLPIWWFEETVLTYHSSPVHLLGPKPHGIGTHHNNLYPVKSISRDRMHIRMVTERGTALTQLLTLQP